MKRAAVIIAPGFEEGEALTIIDIIRRAELPCDSVGLEEDVVTGAHGITMSCDRVLSCISSPAWPACEHCVSTKNSVSGTPDVMACSVVYRYQK